MAKTPEWKLEPFMEYFKNWDINTLMGPELNGNLYCKVCDRYIARILCVVHVEFHKQEKDKLIRKREKIAKKKRLEARLLAAKLKREEKI